MKNKRLVVLKIKMLTHISQNTAKKEEKGVEREI